MAKYVLVGINWAGPEAEQLVPKLEPGHELWIKRAPDNPKDSNAIEVHASRDGAEALKVGFIPKNANQRLALWMDDNKHEVLPAKFAFAGTGKSRVPAVEVDWPDAR